MIKWRADLASDLGIEPPVGFVFVHPSTVKGADLIARLAGSRTLLWYHAWLTDIRVYATKHPDKVLVARKVKTK